MDVWYADILYKRADDVLFLALEEKKMSRLTREERKELERRVELEEIREKKRKEERTAKIVGGIGILVLLSLFPYIWFFQYIDFCFHKNQVQVENVRMVEQGWDDSKGEHFIKFYVDVEVRKYDITNVSFHTLVYKEGKFIGYINSNIAGPTFKQDGTSQYSVFEAETNPTMYFKISGGRNLSNADDLFRELYDGNPEDYTFVVNLMGADFEDGTSVGHVYMTSMDFGYNENGEIQFSDNYLFSKGYWWK